jgi:hypothetical protein
MIKYNNVLKCQTEFSNMCNHAQRVIENSNAIEDSVRQIQNSYTSKMTQIVHQQAKPILMSGVQAIQEVSSPISDFESIIEHLTNSKMEKEARDHMESKMVQEHVFPKLEELGSEEDFENLILRLESASQYFKI